MNRQSTVNQGKRRRFVALVKDSPLCLVDPRAKLLLATMFTFSVMLPLKRLIFFWLFFMIFIAVVRLARAVLLQLRRVALILAILFLIDWIFVDLQFALLITLRLTLLVASFVIFFSTTRPEEFRLALEKLRVPYRYAFSLSLALFSITAMNEEWRAIREAQRSRGIWEENKGFNKMIELLAGAVALGVPEVVLMVKRAWMLTESAHSRGFDSPRRYSYRALIMKPIDWTVVLIAMSATVFMFVWR